MAKKYYGRPITASIEELTFPPAIVPVMAHEAVGTLAAINRHTPVSVAEMAGGGEWVRLESDDLEDHELFQTLRKNWMTISGRNMLNFALIYCIAEPDSGVWLHHLNTWQKKSEYLQGCHQIPSWF